MNASYLYHNCIKFASSAKIFGIRDLHYENIMATIDGPVIIDAECSFGKQVMNTRDFNSTEISELFDALRFSGVSCH